MGVKKKQLEDVKRLLYHLLAQSHYSISTAVFIFVIDIIIIVFSFLTGLVSH